MAIMTHAPRSIATKRADARPATLRARRRVVVAACALSVLGAGCSAPTRYEATVTSTEQGAVVSGWMQSFPFMKVVIGSVDGLPRLGMDTQMPAPLLIDPGDRTLHVFAVYMTYHWLPMEGYAATDFKVHLEPGHRYALKLSRDDELLTFWIEDEATHAEIAARQTIEAKASVIVGGVGSPPN